MRGFESIAQQCAGSGRKTRSRPRTIRFATFLAPNLFSFYKFTTRYVGKLLGCETELVVGTPYEMVAEVDVAFICSLAYVELARQGEPLFEPLAAPVLQGERYGGRPVSYSDVIVRTQSPFRSFEDLRGSTWAYNEPRSQSGYGITRYHLVQRGETRGFFGRVVEAGWHEQAIRMVDLGMVDASAIDAHVLAVAQRDRPELISRLRVIATLGPSSIQPVVASRRLPERLREQLRAALLEMAAAPAAQKALTRNFVERFVPVTSASYQDVRAMLTSVAAAGFLTLR